LAVAAFEGQSAGICRVITDMAMPIMDGPAAIIALKAIKGRQKPSVKSSVRELSRVKPNSERLY
jgi:CheY-like chemotaxis protein